MGDQRRAEKMLLLEIAERGENAMFVDDCEKVNKRG
jgi:hypothetical protein